MHMRHLDMRRVMRSRKNGGLVPEAKGSQPFIGGQTICLNGAAMMYYVSNETLKACCTQVGYMAQADAANGILFYLNSNRHNRYPYGFYGL